MKAAISFEIDFKTSRITRDKKELIRNGKCFISPRMFRSFNCMQLITKTTNKAKINRPTKANPRQLTKWQ